MKQNNINEKEYSAIILAAGKSERMGFLKLSLKYNKNATFIEHIQAEYQKFGCNEIILVVNEIGNQYLIENKIQLTEKVKVVINKHPDWHRFYSLKIGAKSLSEIRPTFIHNVDNPFVNQYVLKKLCDRITEADYVSPEFDGRGGHPFLLSEKVIKEIAQTKEDQKHLKEFLNQFPKMKVPVDDENVLVNINTIDEYEKYFSS
jgi:CTP:molybdopterin cytidylyltransferase MocA